MRRLVCLVAVLATLGGSAAPAASQPRPAPSAADRAELERRVRARFAEIIKTRLGLSDREADRLGEVMRSFEGDRRALRVEEATLRRNVEAFLRAGGDDDARATGLMRGMAELRAREAALFAREQEAMLQVLTPAQLLRFHAVREELAQRVQRVRGGRSGEPGARRRPGGAAGGLPDAGG